MKNRNHAVSIALAVAGLLAVANSAIAEVWDDAPQSTVDVCVAEIREQANLDDATKIRHEVSSERRRSIGHTLRIETKVYGDIDDQVIREYATKCVSIDGAEPLRFRIREVSNGA